MSMPLTHGDGSIFSLRQITERSTPMTQNGKPSISSGTACFLIQDDSLYEKYHAPFFTWLKDSGYTLWPGSRGYSEHVNWVYVNLTSKMFCPGIPGIPVTRAVADHAITIEEFQQIHAIFAKYAGLLLAGDRCVKIKYKHFRSFL